MGYSRAEKEKTHKRIVKDRLKAVPRKGPRGIRDRRADEGNWPYGGRLLQAFRFA